MAAPPPPPPPTSGTHTKTKWSVDMGQAPWSVAQCDPLKGLFSPGEIKWKDAVGMQKSKDGAEGVLFVGWADGSVAVVKGSTTVLADEYAHMVACELGVKQPRWRTLMWNCDPEIHELHAMILRLAEGDPVLQGAVRKIANMPVLAVLDYCQHETDIDHSLWLRGDAAPAVLGDIGRMCMLDVVLNNYDRFPLVWANEGNLGNVIFAERGEERHVFAIDQTVTSVMPGANRDKYINVVTCFLRNLATFSLDDASQDHPLLLLRTFLQPYGPVEDEGMLALHKGMLQAACAVIERLTTERLAEMYDGLNARVDNMIAKMSWGIDLQSRYGLVRVSMDFLVAVRNAFAEQESALKARLASY